MAKQKVVIKVPMEDPRKKSKVMKTVAKHAGVSSIGIEGDDKIAVVGVDMDAVELTAALRKQMRYADIVTVSAVEKEKEKDKDKPSDERQVFVVPPTYPVILHEPRQQSDCCLM